MPLDGISKSRTPRMMSNPLVIRNEAEYLLVLARLKELGELEKLEAAPLWPDAYLDEDAETAFRFLTKCCWTYNETNGETELIPPHDYIRWFCEIWVQNRADGGLLGVEKSRRLIMSWCARGLELWVTGLRPSKGVISGLNYVKAAEHVWRCAWLYRQLAKRRRDFRLADCSTRDGNYGAQQIGQVVYPNGSIITSLNQEGGSFQGSGYTWVTMEEGSQYAQFNYMLSQAKLVTQGKPGTAGGFVTIICNAYPSQEYREFKK